MKRSGYEIALSWVATMLCLAALSITARRWYIIADDPDWMRHLVAILLCALATSIAFEEGKECERRSKQ